MNTSFLSAVSLATAAGIVVAVVYGGMSIKDFYLLVMPIPILVLLAKWWNGDRWNCLGCFRLADRYTPGVIPDCKYYCLCSEFQYVCRKCYATKPNEAYWKAQFGRDHAIRDADESEAKRQERTIATGLATFIKSLNNKTPDANSAINELENIAGRT